MAKADDSDSAQASLEALDKRWLCMCRVTCDAIDA